MSIRSAKKAVIYIMMKTYNFVEEFQDMLFYMRLVIGTGCYLCIFL